MQILIITWIFEWYFGHNDRLLVVGSSKDLLRISRLINAINLTENCRSVRFLVLTLWILFVHFLCAFTEGMGVFISRRLCIISLPLREPGAPKVGRFQSNFMSALMAAEIIPRCALDYLGGVQFVSCWRAERLLLPHRSEIPSLVLLLFQAV